MADTNEAPQTGNDEKAATKKPAAPKEAKAPEPEPARLIVASSPHIRSDERVESLMYSVVLALLPALIGAIVFFGWDAVRVAAWCILGCYAFEAACLAMRGKPLGALRDGSALVTGLLLALNLSAASPWWLALTGAFVAMVLAKHVFGGLGANLFNPALVARVFLLIAFPKLMTSWVVPRWGSMPPAGETGASASGQWAADSTAQAVDAVSTATPLGILKTEGLDAVAARFDTLDLFLGNVGGCLGETSALLLIVGGLFLIWRRVIRWEIPVAYIGTFAALTTVAWAIHPDHTPTPLFHLFAGGLMIGAFFMATDYVTSPMAPLGMLVFGAGCGLITFVIRFFGAFPEGVSFAIVIMNSTVPLIDRYFVPRRVGLPRGD